MYALETRGYLARARARARAPGPRERVGPPALIQKEQVKIFQIARACGFHGAAVRFCAICISRRGKSGRLELPNRAGQSLRSP